MYDRSSITFSSQFIDDYSPEHWYNYPFDESWKNNTEPFYDSDSEMWFGKDIKQLSRRCKRISRKSRKLHAHPTTTCDKNASNINTHQLQQKVDSSSEVKVKPRTSPRSFKPEAPPRKGFKQDVSPASNPEIQDICPIKTPHRNQYRYTSYVCM